MISYILKNSDIYRLQFNKKLITTIKKVLGNNFAYEARSIHFDKKKKTKGIYGNATTDEVKELKEEGINTEIIPWVNEKDN